MIIGQVVLDVTLDGEWDDDEAEVLISAIENVDWPDLARRALKKRSTVGRGHFDVSRITVTQKEIW